jgi:hypothetical protein
MDNRKDYLQTWGEFFFFDDHRSCQKLINYITDKGKIKTISLDPENSSPKVAVHTKLL